MFEIADVSLAVANATPKVRRAATATIGGNAAEGVAEWLALNKQTGKLTGRLTIARDSVIARFPAQRLFWAVQLGTAAGDLDINPVFSRAATAQGEATPMACPLTAVGCSVALLCSTPSRIAVLPSPNMS